jgi:peptidoglycan/xylan/chitin deacetylase (PgdA/CDA1 family)
MTTAGTRRFHLRRLAKLALDALTEGLPSRHGASASLVLAFHNVVPQNETGHGDRSLHLALSAFERFIAVARHFADIVDLPTLVRERRSTGRRIAVTFDDAYRGAVTHGLAACASHGVVPTVFVSPGLYGTTPPWDRLAETGRWSEEDRERFLTTQHGRDNSPPVYDHLLPHSYSIADASELHLALNRFSFHIGNHSFSHANLGRLTEAELRREMMESSAALTVFADVLVPFTAFPYGIAPALSHEHVLAETCEAAFAVSGGWITPSDSFSPFCFPRWNVPAGLSDQGFRRLLKGWP